MGMGILGCGVTLSTRYLLMFFCFCLSSSVLDSDVDLEIVLVQPQWCFCVSACVCVCLLGLVSMNVLLILSAKNPCFDQFYSHSHLSSFLC